MVRNHIHMHIQTPECILVYNYSHKSSILHKHTHARAPANYVFNMWVWHCCVGQEYILLYFRIYIFFLLFSGGEGWITIQ